LWLRSFNDIISLTEIPDFGYEQKIGSGINEDSLQVSALCDRETSGQFELVGILSRYFSGTKKHTLLCCKNW
jgi:hypothetical protein